MHTEFQPKLVRRELHPDVFQSMLTGAPEQHLCYLGEADFQNLLKAVPLGCEAVTHNSKGYSYLGVKLVMVRRRSYFHLTGANT